MKRNSLLTLLLAATCCVAAFAFGPGDAHAVELHWDPVTNAWIRTPTVIIVPTLVSPVRNPRRYYVNVVPPSPVRPVPVVVPQRRVTVHVRQAAPPPPVRVVVDHGRRDVAPATRDPYSTDGLVIAGAGVGGVFLFGDGVTHAALGYKLHLGLAIDAAEFAIRATMVPDAGEVTGPTGLPTESALYAVGASFNYRFLDRAVVHPVFGAGVETLILDPHEGDTGTAFAVTGRAGIEFAYPISDGALALGIDLTGHLPFGVTDQYAADAVAMLDFGAYLDYRF